MFDHLLLDAVSVVVAYLDDHANGHVAYLLHESALHLNDDAAWLRSSLRQSLGDRLGALLPQRLAVADVSEPDRLAVVLLLKDRPLVHQAILVRDRLRQSLPRVEVLTVPVVAGVAVPASRHVRAHDELSHGHPPLHAGHSRRPFTVTVARESRSHDWQRASGCFWPVASCC